MGTSVVSPRYRIVETLGKGGMGEVCLADDLQLDRRVALKFLTTHEGDAMEQLLLEARSAAALDHPFICRIHEVTEIDGRPCIVMEYVRGETLERRLRRGRLPIADVLRLAEEVAEALEAAHKRRVIHRDLKPANVMITDDQHIKVMDFGLATRLAESTDEGATVVTTLDEVFAGTPAYMAPEQVGGHPADRSTDIFSFGVVVYELLSGTHPFVRPSLDSTIAAIVAHVPADPSAEDPRIPQSVADLVVRLLAKDPGRRPSSFGEIRQELHRIAGTLSSPGSSTRRLAADAGVRLPAARLPGRDRELKDLIETARQATAGQGALVLIGGDPGIGKSRLTDELLTAVRQMGCHALRGRCIDQEGSPPPLVAYVEILEELVRFIPASTLPEAVGRSAPELAKLLPELQRLFPEMAPPLELPPELRQRFLFTNVREFFTRAARVTPLVIALEDFQWADESTVLLTQHLAQHLQTLPILVIAVHRTADPSSAPAPAPVPSQTGGLRRFFQRMRGQPASAAAPLSVARDLDRWVTQRLARPVHLRPLTEEAVGAMLAELGPGPAPPKVAHRFFDETEGNPYFVEELYRHLSQEGHLFDSKGRWNRTLAIDAIELPPSIRAVVDRRLQRVTQAAHEVLAVAAIVGRQFDLELLERVAGVDPQQVIAALDEAERAELVKGPSGRLERHWRFPHPLVWQTLVSATLPSKRQRVHLRVAEEMARLDTSSMTAAGGLAHHLYSAGPLADAARTAGAAIAAGDAAFAVYATDEARQQYRRALEVLEEARADERTRLAVQERLADLSVLSGDRADALHHYRALVAAHAAQGDRVSEARSVRKLGNVLWHGGERPQAMNQYQRALTLLEGVPPGIETAQLYQELGLAAFRTGDNIRATDWAERALKVAEAAVADEQLSPEDRRLAAAAVAHATNTIGVALARSGQLEAARERIEQSIAAARQQELLEVACRGYANLGVVYGSVEPQRAIDVSLTGLELASKIGAASLQSYIYANLAAAYCSLTDRCEAEGLEAANTAAQLDRELGQLDHLAVPLIVLGQIHQCHGRLDLAQESYREALALAEKIREPQLLLPCYDGLATIHLDRGDRKLAEQYMLKARDLCERTGLDPDALLLLPFLC